MSKYPKTKVNAFEHMQFDIDVPKFLKELIENSGQRMYAPTWNILKQWLLAMTQRATELNDPVMNAIMLHMGMYDVPANMRHEQIDKMKEEYEKQNKTLKQ